MYHAYRVLNAAMLSVLQCFVCVSMWELISFHAVFTMCVIAYAKEASVRHKA